MKRLLLILAAIVLCTTAMVAHVNTTENSQSSMSQQEECFTIVDQMPEFPGGQVALIKFLCENIQYPPEAQKNKIQGKVIVQFLVTKTGKVSEVRVVRSVDPDLDKEAVRVCKLLPNFTPGRKNGQPVNVWYTLPITFTLQAEQYDTEE